MFYYKKNEDKLAANIDYAQIHSSMEIHVMAEGKVTKCPKCNTTFKDGDPCMIVTEEGKLVVNHQECKKVA